MRRPPPWHCPECDARNSAFNCYCAYCGFDGSEETGSEVGDATEAAADHERKLVDNAL